MAVIVRLNDRFRNYLTVIRWGF